MVILAYIFTLTKYKLNQSFCPPEQVKDFILKTLITLHNLYVNTGVLVRLFKNSIYLFFPHGKRFVDSMIPLVFQFSLVHFKNLSSGLIIVILQ